MQKNFHYMKKCDIIIKNNAFYSEELMKIKESRALSFIVVTLVYALCTLVGVGQYGYLPYSTFVNLLIADTASTVCCFIFSLIFKNSSVYDPYWSVAPIVIVIAYAVRDGLTSLGVLMLIAVCFWGVRLTANWAYTFKGLRHQDWRYTMLKEKTGKFYPLINFVGIHYVPTLVVYGCMLPVVAVIEKQGADQYFQRYLCLRIAFCRYFAGSQRYSYAQIQKKQKRNLYP